VLSKHYAAVEKQFEFFIKLWIVTGRIQESNSGQCCLPMVTGLTKRPYQAGAYTNPFMRHTIDLLHLKDAFVHTNKQQQQKITLL
jgi:hypothetical protein